MNLVGTPVQTRDGRRGIIIAHDPSDKLLEMKVQFCDDASPQADWFSGADIFAITMKADEEDNVLFELWEDEGIGAKHGLVEIEGGIGGRLC